MVQYRLINTRSLNDKKFSVVEHLLSTTNSILAVTESWAKDFETRFKLKGYNIFGGSRAQKQGAV